MKRRKRRGTRRDRFRCRFDNVMAKGMVSPIVVLVVVIAASGD